MSHTAHIPSHRKPRRNASKTAIRSGVAGGVLSTIALAGAAAPANAEPVTETIEMPTLTSGLAGSVAQSAAATQQVAVDLELQAQEDAAAAKAAKLAKTAQAEAERKAEAKAKAEKAARAEAAAQERASRSEERTTLSAPSSSAAPASQSTTQASGSAAAVLAFARAQVGDAYVLGSTGPDSWDCSSLVQAAYRQAGIDLPRTSQPQSTSGTQVSLDNLQPGDILYWGGAGSAYHVGIYSGGGKFIGAQNSGTGVVEKTLDWDPPSGAVRIL
ncbi:C40 family peptidase [Streptomyces sp. NBC_01506]|uniref:C40 family peptidase n=1 Tax=Streptomyces sp. NBC_01506 TaxID=2903887 RepID=UPI00386FE9A3